MRMCTYTHAHTQLQMSLQLKITEIIKIPNAKKNNKINTGILSEGI